MVDHNPNFKGQSRPRIERFLSKDPAEASDLSVRQVRENVDAVLNYTDAGTDPIGLTEYYIQPPPDGDEVWIIYRLIVLVADQSVSADRYGAIDLENGVGVNIIHTDQNDEEILLYTQLAVKSNAAWGAYCYDSSPSDYGSGPEYVGSRWSFFKGSPYATSLNRGEKLKVVLNDDFSSLVAHTFFVEGWRVQFNPTFGEI